MKNQLEIIAEAYKTMLNENLITHEDLHETDDEVTPNEKLEILKNPNVNVNLGAVNNTKNHDVLVAMANHPSVTPKTLNHMATNSTHTYNEKIQKSARAVANHKNADLETLRVLLKNPFTASIVRDRINNEHKHN